MDADFIRELFADFGEVHVRRMFGGAGLFSGGLMFGLVVDDLIYLKAETGDVAAFETEGCRPFEYATKDGKRTLVSYWRLPDRLYDDPQELAEWAKRAAAAARKTAAQKSSPRARTKRGKN